MAQGGSIAEKALHLGVFLALEAACLGLVSRQTNLRQSRLMGIVHSVGGWFSQVERGVASWFSLARTNRSLLSENQRLTEEVFRLGETLRLQRVALREKGMMEDSLRTDGFSCLAAEAIRVHRGSQHNYLILDKGHRDGVRENSGVVTRNGIVGIVKAVSAHYCYVTSFQNYGFSVSARIGREGSCGILNWDGKSDQGAILRDIPIQEAPSPGDTLFSSGHSLLFPPDIPLGLVGEAQGGNGTSLNVKVTLLQRFSAVRHVAIVCNPSFAETQALPLP